MNNVTFIIPNRGGTNIPYVINNFEKTFNEYFEEICFIIIEQEDELPFKRGQLYNIAMNFVKTEWIGLIDNDIVNIDKFNPIEMYKNFGYRPFLAFDKIAQLTLTNDGFDITKTELRTSGFGAFNFMKVNDFKIVNGFSNLCFGWGAEDNILNHKINFKRYVHTLGHITHPRRTNTTPKLTDFNRQILKEYIAGKIDKKLDGMAQTTFTLRSNVTNGNVTTIKVNNIGVSDDYAYMSLFNSVKQIENEYSKGENIENGISICVTAYKSVDYIKECIDSIAYQDWSTIDKWEILIGIDGCEETFSCLKTFINNYPNEVKKHVRVLVMDCNKGTYITSNTLMLSAKYSKLMRFDSDDIMPSNFIKNVTKEADSYDILRLRYKSFGVDTFPGVANGAIIINKTIFNKYGGYQAWKVAADYELLERLKDKVKIGISTVNFNRRLHGTDSLQYSEETGDEKQIKTGVS